MLAAEGSVGYSRSGIPSVDGDPLVDGCWHHTYYPYALPRSPQGSRIDKGSVPGLEYSYWEDAKPVQVYLDYC